MLRDHFFWIRQNGLMTSVEQCTIVALSGGLLHFTPAGGGVCTVNAVWIVASACYRPQLHIAYGSNQQAKQCMLLRSVRSWCRFRDNVGLIGIYVDGFTNKLTYR